MKTYMGAGMKRMAVFLITLLVLAPNAFAAEETPQQGLTNIITLYKTKNFERLIRERYSEIYKAEALEKVEELIKKFSHRMSNEDKLQKVIRTLGEIQKVNPEIIVNSAPRETETEKMATFRFKENTYTLYLQKTGKWGFHM